MILNSLTSADLSKYKDSMRPLIEKDINNTRLHHEIYLSDARKTPIEKQKTIIRHPIKIAR